MDLQPEPIEFYTKVKKTSVKYDEKRFARVVTITLEAHLSTETKALEDATDGRHFLVRFTEVAAKAAANPVPNPLGRQLTLDDAEVASESDDDAFARAFPQGVR